jgi:hypothetical protein
MCEDDDDDDDYDDGLGFIAGARTTTKKRALARVAAAHAMRNPSPPFLFI